MSETTPSSRQPQGGISRRSAIRLLVGAAVLPPVVDSLTGVAVAQEATAPGQAPLPLPLRRLDKPGLTMEPVATIAGRRHRATFFRAAWEGGWTYVREMEVRDGRGWLRVTDAESRFDEQWVVLTGSDGNPNDYYTSMTPNWVSFDSLRQLDDRTVELRSTPPGAYDLTVRWSLVGDNPELHWTITAGRDSNYVVGYQSFDAVKLDGVDEVLCGTRQHAKFVEGSRSLGAWELFAPMSLTERRLANRQVTMGVYVPGEVLLFEHERELGPDGQPFAMSLGNDDRDVQPVVFAPQIGSRSSLAAGESRGYAFGLYAAPGSMYDAYTDLTRNEYGYTDYRRNVYETSLTDTVHNIIDLILIEPAQDDSETFVPSFSGWWNRGKGFADIENDRAIRTTVASALLSAFYLTGDTRLYDKRARPLIEYHVSRPGHGSTPIIGKPVYGNRNLYRIGRVSGDASTLVPIYEQTRGQNAGIHNLAMDLIRRRPPREARTPMSNPLQAYLLTRNPAYLAELRAEARRYLRDEIMRPYTTNQPENGFAYWHSKAWTELLVTYEITGDQDILDAAHREAKRFITQTQVRPVPDTTVTVPNQPFIDSQVKIWPDGTLLPDYPVRTVKSEQVPAWMVSTCGVTYEQLTTLRIPDDGKSPVGGLTWIPCRAGFLLRLAEHTGDRLIRDVAHNLVVGRYTNYPGYYSRQHSVTQMKPRFPLEGPNGVSAIYYHHAPAQLAMTVDYLISEHVTRSASRIDFPKHFETNYVFFRYYVYGHAPGVFYGEDNVWPYFPKGIVAVDNPQVNWFTGIGNNSLYLSLTSESEHTEPVTIGLATVLTGLDPRRRYDAEIIRDNGSRTPATVLGGKLTTTVSAKGITAVVIRGVEITVPWHWTSDTTDRSSSSYHFEDIDPGSDQGLVRGMLLVRPDRSGYEAYVQIDVLTEARMVYSIDGGAEQEAPAKVFPFEWTIPVDDLASTFTYRVVSGNRSSQPRTLRLPPAVTGIVPRGQAACGELSCSPDTTPGDSVRVQARLRNGSGAVLESASVSLSVPDRWSVDVADQVPTEVSVDGTAVWTFDVGVPDDATIAKHALTARATWAGGSTDLEATDIEVIAPLKVTMLTGDPSVLAKPGDALKITAAVLNMGPVPRRGPLTLTAPPGWHVSAAVEYDVPGRSESEYTFSLTSPTAAPPGGTHRISVALPDAPARTITVLIASREIVVDDSHSWPTYTETGWWNPSGLVGWNGTSRYSEEGKLGGTATWRPDLPNDGIYDVAVWYPTNPATTTAAVYQVHHADGEEEYAVNQQQDANGWRHLGRYRFAAGTDGYLRLVVRNSGFHRADAARFELVVAAE
ncbi:golvesin C-terminal-like domain-containing protein [Kribbella turkmenica]|uniref:golvesin C-terminal-like domain-containing protein n=1 Tax=Kribbella turkmenica TaxID=2530375 RepID=UPI001404AEC1|nr:NEW3 domain-containing protein [Kribbella turkmenica]